MLDTKLKLFGFRVLVEQVKERTGRIVVPENANIIFAIGRIVAVGDGAQPNGTKEEAVVNLGDIVYFQTNAMLAATQNYQFEGKHYLNLHQGDLLGRLSDTNVCYENFEPLGRWVMVQPFQRTAPGGILLPETANDADFTYFRVAKLGSRVKLDIKEGQEVIVNTGRISPIRINKLDLAAAETRLTDYGLLDRDFVLGAVEDAEKQVVMA